MRSVVVVSPFADGLAKFGATLNEKFPNCSFGTDGGSCKVQPGRRILIAGGGIDDYWAQELLRDPDWNLIRSKYGDLHDFVMECRWVDLVIEVMEYAFSHFEGKLWLLDSNGHIFRADEIDLSILAI